MFNTDEEYHRYKYGKEYAEIGKTRERIIAKRVINLVLKKIDFPYCGGQGHPPCPTLSDIKNLIRKVDLEKENVFIAVNKELD